MKSVRAGSSIERDFRVRYAWILVVISTLFLSACKESATAPEDTTAPTDTNDELTAPGPPPPPDAAFLARLSPEETAQIDTLGVPIVVPTAIPEGFGVDEVIVRQEDRVSGYQILYRDDRDRCFLVEYTSGGVGDVPQTESRRVINPPLVNDGNEYALNYGPYSDDGLRSQFPAPELVTDWLPFENRFYRLSGAALINTTLSPDTPCQDVTVDEAAQIVESFAVITNDITGDG